MSSYKTDLSKLATGRKNAGIFIDVNTYQPAPIRGDAQILFARDEAGTTFDRVVDALRRASQVAGL